MATTLRLAQQGEGQRLLSLMDGDPEASPGDRSAATLAIRDVQHCGGDHRLWVIEQKRGLIGFVVLRLVAHGWRGLRVLQLEGAYLAPGYRAQGIMRDAVRFLDELGRSPGNYPLILGAERGRLLGEERFHRGPHGRAAAHTETAA